MDTAHHGFELRKVGDVVAEDYLRAAVFKRHGIDFCCGGGRTVAEACDRAGVEYDQVEQELLAVGKGRGGDGHPDPRGWDLDFLADYIVNVHHRYVKESLPVLLQFSRKVARVHGNHRPELVEIARLVEELASELEPHLAKEEQVLFPYIRTLAAANRSGASVDPAPVESAGEAMRAMESEHDHAGVLMRKIRELSEEYRPPEGACNTYRATFAKLEEFEDDLHRHVHLENNLLFPGALSLEGDAQAA